MTVLPLNLLPIGFRFRPTDKELIDFYLRSKINGKRNDESEKYVNSMSVNVNRGIYPIYPLYRVVTRNGFSSALSTGNTPTALDSIGLPKPVTGRPRNPFVICRLFKKQDESIEDINGDEVDPAAASSPTEDMQSGLEGPQDSPPAVEVVAQKFPDIDGTFTAGLPSEVVSNVVAPELEFSVYDDDYEAYGVTGQLAEIASGEVDPLQEALEYFYDPMGDSADFKLFSPLHSQIDAEQAPEMFDHVGNNFNGVEFEHETNENEASISDFLDSILNYSDDCYGVDSSCPNNSAFESEIPEAMSATKDGIMTRESHLGTETANRGTPLEIKGELSNHVNTACNLDNAFTGIRIRPRPARDQPNIENSVTQGYAPRRIRLQCKLQASVLYPSDAITNGSEGKEDDLTPVVSKEGKVREEEIGADSDVSCGTINKNRVLKSKVIVSVAEEIPPHCSKKLSASRWHKPFGVVFWVAVPVMLILLVVLVSRMNIL